MIEGAGLDVRAESGILFIPGWLRMLDLVGHTRFAPLTWITKPAVALFEALDARIPRLRRHGYLLASVGVKPAMAPLAASGLEYVIDARGCRPSALRSRADLERLTSRIIRDLQLRVIGTPAWHTFPGPGGVTGLVMLAESHLSVHTFPERGYAAINLYCCRPIADWPWQTALREALGATDVTVRTLTRGAAS